MSPSDAESRLRRSEFFLQELDANHNGVIEAEEVDGRRRYYADKLLQRAGLETNYPIAVSKVREGVQRYYQPYISGTAPGMMPGTTPGYTPSGGSPGQPAQPSPAELERRRQIEQLLSDLKHLDRNGNGVIEPDEATGGQGHSHKEMFEKLMAKAGLPATPPVKLDQVRDRLMAALQSGGPSGSTPGGPVPGFGAPQPALAQVPGFGPVAAVSTVSTSRPVGGMPAPASPPGTTASSGSLPPPRDEQEVKLQNYAKGLLEKYDKNKDGFLQPDEYKEMKGEVRTADRNGDGKVSLEELTNWMRQFNQGHGHGDRPSGDSGRRSSSASTQKPIRFSTALDRLPDGLPDWFLQKDADHDGQVAMAEFSSSWSEEKVNDFFRYDANRDGIITPAECLAVEKAKQKK